MGKKSRKNIVGGLRIKSVSEEVEETVQSHQISEKTHCKADTNKQENLTKS